MSCTQSAIIIFALWTKSEEIGWHASLNENDSRSDDLVVYTLEIYGTFCLFLLKNNEFFFLPKWDAIKNILSVAALFFCQIAINNNIFICHASSISFSSGVLFIFISRLAVMVLCLAETFIFFSSLFCRIFLNRKTLNRLIRKTIQISTKCFFCEEKNTKPTQKKSVFRCLSDYL